MASEIGCSSGAVGCLRPATRDMLGRPRSAAASRSLPLHRRADRADSSGVRRIRDLSLARKLGLSFALVVALLLVSLAVTAHHLSRLQSLERASGRTAVAKATAIDDAQVAASDMHFAQTKYVLDGGQGRADYQ